MTALHRWAALRLLLRIEHLVARAERSGVITRRRAERIYVTLADQRAALDLDR